MWKIKQVKQEQTIGAFLYVSITARPDISAVGILCWKVNTSTYADWAALYEGNATCKVKHQ